MSKKFLYLFKEGHDAFGGDQTTMKNTLGGKGAGLAEMTHAGMPVPQGFTITTEACTQYYADNREINDEIKADIFKYMGILEEQTGKTFGSIENPLLVSVRSGARQSMPGMMDTILNLGLNDEAVEGLAKKTNNARFAYDCYRRFVQMFADVVMMVPKSLFEVETYLRQKKRERERVRVFRALLLVSFLVLWEVAADLRWIDPFIFSSPVRVGKTFVTLLTEQNLLRHIGITVYETGISFLLVSALGMAFAVLLWLFPRFSAQKSGFYAAYL